MVTGLLALASARFFLRNPLQLLSAIVGVILGVAIVTAILITNASANRAFTLSSEAITGLTTHHVMGGETGVPQQWYVQQKRSRGYPMTPVVEGHITVGKKVLTVMGIDPFSATEFNHAGGLFQGNSGITEVLLSGGIVGGANTLADADITLHTPVNALVAGRDKTLQVDALLTTRNPAATRGLLIADIATAQQLLDRENTLDRVDFRVSAEDAALLSASLPPALQLTTAARRSETMIAMTRGFQINLTAMSLLALLVGAFLIHNTMTFSVLQRRELFAVMRITGATTGQVFRLIMAEAFVISLLGTLAGVAVGYYLSTFLIRLTTRTINDLYFVLHVQEIWFSAPLALLVIAAGLATGLLATLVSAREAAGITPMEARQRSIIETRTQYWLPRIALAGLCTMLPGWLLTFWPGQSLIPGFLALLCLICGFGMLIPFAVYHGLRMLVSITPPALTLLTIALRGLQRSISRTGLAIAALTIAVSATFGVDIMIGSFRHSVDQWLTQTLQSDIYVTLPGTISERAQGAIDPAFGAAVAQLPGVTGVSNTRTLKTQTNAGTINLLVLEPHHASATGFNFTQRSTSSWADWLSSDAILISEPLATRHELSMGDTLSLFTGRDGFRDFPIAGIYVDYGSSHGQIAIARTSYNRYWVDRGYTALGIELDDTTDADTVVDSLTQLQMDTGQPLLVRSNRDIHAISLSVFDQTFQVTKVLRLLTVGVAFMGIFSALLALQLEKARDFAVLRATGITQWQTSLIVILQTLVMGLIAGLAALPLGWLMSEVLINVINVRSFGWRMGSLLPPGSVSVTLTVALLSSLLAGLYPAYRLARQPVAALLRDE